MFDFLEVGSCDFDNEMGIGVFIEPVKLYYDKIRLNLGCKKYNCAISDASGTATVYYLEEKDITKHCLPWWLRGCNSIDSFHPQALKIVEERGLNWVDLVKSHGIKKYSLYEFLVMENIVARFLKIDAEGHDCIILNKFLEECDNELLFPKKIMFESNFLIDNKTVENTINKLKDKMYTVSYFDGSNTTLTRQ